MDVRILNIATSNPKLRLTQKQSLQILNRTRKLSRIEKVLYKRFLLDPGINTRYFALDKIKDIFIEDQDLLIKRFQKEASHLSVSALKKCFKESKIKEENIDCLIVVTCTGYLCPGLSSYIIEKTKLRKDIYIVDIVGMGCGGAIPAIQSAYNFLKANKKSTALVISTEICSSAITWGNDPELILSNSIFGDGSAACLVTNKNGTEGFRILDFKSRIMPSYRDELRFKIENSRLRNVMKITVPEIAASILKDLVSEKDGIKYWAIHPGGRKVLDKIQDTLELRWEDLQYSRNVLYNYGNMSSPTVLFVLKEIKPRLGERVIMASFGAGFSGYSALLEYV